ncbi:MAG: DNA replication/repair protein RecF [Alphaproteobacteria bacterium]
MAGAAIAVRSLRLTGFRNHAATRLTLEPAPVVLTGANGAGKTNLLEAVSLLAPGRGLRNARVTDPLPPKTELWGLAAEIDGPSGLVEVGTGLDPDSLAEKRRPRRQIRIEGERNCSQTDLAEHMVQVWLTPQQDGLFTGSASSRRRWLDRVVFSFDPAHAGRVTRHDKLLRERAKLLKQGGADPHWLTSLEAQMAEAAVAIAAARLDIASRLARACHRQSGPFPAASIAVSGFAEEAIARGDSAVMVEDALQGHLTDARPRDAAAGGALVGAHRADLLVHWLANDRPAEACSTGEQKALLISLTLATARLLAAETGYAPVILLDEIAAHLDPDRRTALYDLLIATGAQFWLTGTEEALFQHLLTEGTAQHIPLADGQPLSVAS